MGSVEVRSAVGLSDEDLAALFTEAYEDYLVPFAVDAAAVRFMTETYDLDREASRVALRDGQQVGLANLGLRGPDAWVGGIGVVPGERGKGTGRLLMDTLHEEARSRGAERVWLEVIVENAPAIALYETLGYEHVRDVVVWSLPGTHSITTSVSEVAAIEAHAWLRERRTEREPWQRDDASLSHQSDLRGLLGDDAAAVVRAVGGRVGVVQLGGDAAALRGVLETASSLGESLSVLNLPDGHAASGALEELGGHAAVRQHEMVLTL